MEYLLINPKNISTAALTHSFPLPNSASTSQISKIQVSTEPAVVNHYTTQSLKENAYPDPTTVTLPMTDREFMEQQYRNGSLLNLPTRRPWSEEEKTERARLARLFAGGKPASEMVIEDRGPY
jgi:hypothetical protein